MSVRANMERVVERVRIAWTAAASPALAMPRLVAVSKTQPVVAIAEAYEAGQRHFGENYIQELEEKSSDASFMSSCPDIRFHFIGKCQSNKASKLVKCANLYMVETLTSQKLADRLQSSCKENGKELKVMIQVNTSGEENKNGVEPNDAADLATYVANSCPNLKFVGLMTIGALGHSLASSSPAAEASNPDFACLVACRQKVASALGVPDTDLELSMGMSSDFEEAVRVGSTSVRVGSSIFGARNYN